MKNFLAGIGMSFLPRTWWGSWQPESTVYYRWATMLSGMLQFLGFLFVSATLYFQFLSERGRVYGGGGGARGVMTLIFVTLEYLIYPHHLALGYLTVEGAARALGAFATGDLLPSLPLWLAARLQQRLQAKAVEAALGPRVSDTVDRVEGLPYELRIASCRPKEKWKDKLLTISYEEQFYEVVREERGEWPRQFVYLLRKAPESKVIRGHHYYDPNEPLRGDDDGK
ncbi:MAG TPA: hypothetical protein VLB32_08415 [Candidatus Acidoferrales bacterium]|nr:hypothetical protein [Candidatus Acidoferrales bacterium]